MTSDPADATIPVRSLTPTIVHAEVQVHPRAADSGTTRCTVRELGPTGGVRTVDLVLTDDARPELITPLGGTLDRHVGRSGT